jgi:hypothetical protein
MNMQVENVYYQFGRAGKFGRLILHRLALERDFQKFIEQLMILVFIVKYRSGSGAATRFLPKRETGRLLFQKHYYSGKWPLLLN